MAEAKYDTIAKMKKSNIKIGFLISDCANEINTKLARLSNSSNISQLDYLVCNTRPFIPNNVDRQSMDNYLNEMFYMKKYIETYARVKLGTRKDFRVYFRLNLFAESYCRRNVRKSTNAFLRFLNDVNQHSLTYKINYFNVKAIENEINNGECSKSWWKLKNYNNLSNPLAYVDREEEYFGRPTKLTLQLLPESIGQEKLESNGNFTLTLIFSVVSLFLVFAVVAFWFSWQQSRKRYLAEKEVNEFYNGVIDGDGATDTSKWLGVGFPKSYEIAKSKIEIGRLIGTGEFGKVFMGKIDEELIVAIKIPQPNGSKEKFKSALNEVKILCFVGNGEHLNVILFLGAYTREIVNGKLYIMTEYCTNGSLQTYLRQHQIEHTCVDFYELNKFAHEIASGMEYISGKRVVHGDLSTRNIFLDEGLNCKIGDFGLSRKLYEYNEYVKKGQDPLPWRWMAIETLKNMEFTVKSDIWSYGVTVWEIFSLGALPYPGLSWSPDFLTDLENGMRMVQTKLASANLHEQLLLCWNCKANGRPTFSELVIYFAEQRQTEYTNVIE